MDDRWDVVEPWGEGDEELAGREHVRPEPSEELGTPQPTEPAGVELTDQLATIVRAEVQAASEGITRDIGHLRYQLAGLLQDAAALTREHQQFRQRLIAQQHDMVDKIVAPVLAERDATMGRLHAESRRLGDQLTGVIGGEIAGQDEARKLFEQALADRIASQDEARKLFEQGLADQIANHADVQKLLQQGLVDQMARQADAQALLEQSLVERIATLAEAQKRFEQGLVEDIAKLADEQAQFQQGLLGRQNDLVDKVVAAALAQRDVSLGRVGEENESLRRQLKGDLQEEVTQLGQRLVDQQGELVERLVAPAQAERETTLSLLHDQLAGLIHDEFAKLTDDQQRLADRLTESATQGEATMPAELEINLHRIRDEIAGLVLDRIEMVTDEQRKFRTRIATAAGVAESRFGAFAQTMSARLDQLDQTVDRGAAPEPGLDQLARAVAGVVDQQQRMDTMLVAIQDHLDRLEQQAKGPIQLDDNQLAILRKALAPSPAAKKQPTAQSAAAAKTALRAKSKGSPGVKKAPARPTRGPGAPKKRTSG